MQKTTKHKSPCILFIFLLVAMLAGCEGFEFSDEEVYNGGNTGRNIAVPPSYQAGTANVDIMGANNDVYFDFSSGTLTEVEHGADPEGDWDIMFTGNPEIDKGAEIIANEAESVFFYSVEAPIEDVTSVSILDFEGPGNSGCFPFFFWVICGDAPYPSLGKDWYGSPPDYVLAEKTFVISTAEGNYAKFQMLSYFGGETGDQAYMADFTYFYLPDGSKTFPDVECEDMPPLRCRYDNSFKAGRWACRDMPPCMLTAVARQMCERDTLGISAEPGTLTEDNTCSDSGFSYKGSCTYPDGSIEWFESGDCSNDLFSNQWGCAQTSGTTFNCLL